MSDNDDLLGDDLGDQSLADYNLGNEEEEQLLADDYDSGSSQNVPPSVGHSFGDPNQMVANDYSDPGMDYGTPLEPYIADAECVVPNITVDVPNVSSPSISLSRPEPLPTYAPYEPPPYEEHAVPPVIPAAPVESPQIVPSEVLTSPIENGDLGNSRERFISERPPGAQRMPQVRDIPDSLDKVMVPRGSGFNPRGRTSWRNPHFNARFSHPYRRNNMQRGNFQQRPSFPAPQRGPELNQMPPQERPNLPPQMPPNLPPNILPELVLMQVPQFRPERPMFNPNMNRFPNQNFQPNMRPPFQQYRPPYRPFQPPNQMGPNMGPGPRPQIIRQPLPPGVPGAMDGPKIMPAREPEVRMLPVQLPTTLPPGGLQGKKVLINPHFKGNFQPPVEGPIKDIDDAAERFIAEQRNALARAANRKMTRRSPQRFIENTTIEIENEFARGPPAPPRAPPPSADDDLLRRQEEFINANRAGLRRRMRSPSPPRRSPSPRRSLSPRRRASPPPRFGPLDEESEYKRRVREQETLRERVLRAKEVRRRRNAAALQKQLQERERERLDKERQEKESTKPDTNPTDRDRFIEPPALDKEKKSPRKSPERDRSPTKPQDTSNENLTPPRENIPKLPIDDEKSTKLVEMVEKSPERNLTPPLPVPKKIETKVDSDDDLDLILDDIEGILSDDEDSGRFKEKAKKPEPQPRGKPPADLRSKLPAKPPGGDGRRPNKQRIIFNDGTDRRKREKTPPKQSLVTSSTNTENNENIEKKQKLKQETENASSRSRQRIIFDNKEKEPEKVDKPTEDTTKKTLPFTSRRVVLQRKITATLKTDKPEKSVFSRIEIKADPTKPNPGIFSRAVRTAIGSEKSRIVLKKQEEPQIEYESDSEIDEDKLLNEEVGNIAVVTNLPHGMTDTRLKTLAGNDVQSLNLNKEERSAKITFKTTVAAENFRKKFNSKMVAASRLTVTLR